MAKNTDNRRQDNEEKKGKTGWKVMFLLSLCVVAGALAFVGWYLYQGYMAEKAAAEIQEQVVIESSTSEVAMNSEIVTDDGADGDAAELPENIITELDIPIDFTTLQSINADLYAWIRIPDTNIDYPIAQNATDDEFYLHHDMYGAERYAGSIYTESLNAQDFSDPVTVIYGHNMKNGSMFHDLRKYQDKNYFNDHSQILIYTPDAIREYKVFAAYTYDDRHLLNSFNFSDKTVYAQYLQDVQRGMNMNANLRDDLQVTENDRIITLSTCVGAGDSNERYLVQAVLINEQILGQPVSVAPVVENSDGTAGTADTTQDVAQDATQTTEGQ